MVGNRPHGISALNTIRDKQPLWPFPAPRDLPAPAHSCSAQMIKGTAGAHTHAPCLFFGFAEEESQEQESSQYKSRGLKHPRKQTNKITQEVQSQSRKKSCQTNALLGGSKFCDSYSN